MPRYFYSIYGLAIKSNRLIPRLRPMPASMQVDLDVRCGERPCWMGNDPLAAGLPVWYISPYTDEQGAPGLVIYELAGGEYLWLCYSDGVEFVLERRGIGLWAIWPETMPLEDVALYLLGPVLGIVLYLRGALCLHASAVAMGGRAVAFVGDSGAGKSTTAAAFARLGYPVLAEDVVVLREVGGEWLVPPAYPYVRLWAPSVEMLFGNDQALPRLSPSWEKRGLDLLAEGYQFQSEPLPLGAVYFLGGRRRDPAAPMVQAMSAADGLITLLTNSYAVNLPGGAARGREFISFGRVAAQYPLKRIIPHADPTRLISLCSTILEDLGHQVAGEGVDAQT
jgi:hypothetical protein